MFVKFWRGMIQHFFKDNEYYDMPTLKAGKTQGGPVFLLRMPVWLGPKRSAAMGYEKVYAAGVSCLPQTSSMTLNAFFSGYMFSLEMRWGLEE